MTPDERRALEKPADGWESLQKASAYDPDTSAYDWRILCDGEELRYVLEASAEDGVAKVVKQDEQGERVVVQGTHGDMRVAHEFRTGTIEIYRRPRGLTTGSETP